MEVRLEDRLFSEHFALLGNPASEFSQLFNKPLKFIIGLLLSFDLGRISSGSETQRFEAILTGLTWDSWVGWPVLKELTNGSWR